MPFCVPYDRGFILSLDCQRLITEVVNTNFHSLRCNSTGNQTQVYCFSSRCSIHAIALLRLVNSCNYNGVNKKSSLTSSASDTRRVSSTATTASAPGGMGAPVVTRTARPNVKSSLFFSSTTSTSPGVSAAEKTNREI